MYLLAIFSFASLAIFSNFSAMEPGASSKIHFLYGIKRPVCYDDPETFNGNCQRFSQTLVHKVTAYGAQWKKLGHADKEPGNPCSITRLAIKKDITPYTEKQVARALIREVATHSTHALIPETEYLSNCAEVRVQFSVMQEVLMRQLAAGHGGKITVVVPVDGKD
jgi:hypothetical protein